jgi:hypothetical protein
MTVWAAVNTGATSTLAHRCNQTLEHAVDDIRAWVSGR